MLQLATCLCTLLAASYAKPVEVSLEAPWQTPDDAVLALETITQYNASSYFPLLSMLVSKRMENSSCASDVDLISMAAQAGLLEEPLVNVAKAEFALGSQLSLFEGHYQLFESIANQSSAKLQDCPVVTWVEGKYSCDKLDIFALQARETPELPQVYATDHVIGSGPQWVVAYADISSAEFPDWHAALLEMALANKITYILRYRPSSEPSGSSGSLKLAGYGAGFNVKRTDYLVIDDRQHKSEINIDKNAASKISSRKIPYLGFAAAKQIRKLETPKAQFDMLKMLSYDFPHRAVKLAKTAGESDADNEGILQKLGALGMNAMFIDGEYFTGHDAFEFFEAVHRELNIQTTVKQFLPNNTDIAKLLASGVALDEFDEASGTLTRPKQRYDLRADQAAIGWVNDVESDLVFQALPNDLEIIKDAKGPFVPLKRNMHSVVVVGDLEDPRVLMLLKGLFQQTGHHLPLQIGVVSENETWQRIASLGLETRQAYLIQKILGSSTEEAEVHAREVYKEAGNPVRNPLADPAEWLDRFQLGALVSKEPILFVNGVPLTLETWKAYALMIFENDFDYLQSLPSLPQNDSIRDLLFSTGLPARQNIVDPLDGVIYAPWPLVSPIQAFKNPQMNSTADIRHSVLFSSSFESPEAFEIVDALLTRSIEQHDVEVYVRPLSGIDKRFYAAMLDPTYNTFRFSRELFNSVKSHLFLQKTAPRVLTVAKEPESPLSQLPVDTDSLIIDGRYVELAGEVLGAEELGKLIDRESTRISRIHDAVPEISGLGIAALTAATQGRTMITDEDKPDISLNTNGSLKVTTIVDPASTDGQILVALTELAADSGMAVDIHLSPTEIEEMPTRVFRPVFNRTEAASFDSLADDVLYSAELVEPSGWLIMASRCKYDLDNVILNTVKEDTLDVVYKLKGLLVQGYARGSDSPGTPLTLRTLGGTKIGDTSVMTNLGYFQLLAPRPGLYAIHTSDPRHSISRGSDTVASINVPVLSSSGATVQLEILHQTPSVVDQISNKGPGSVWSKLKSAVGMASQYKDDPATKADINIFTVASGHLYERLASIMMLSVMQHSKHSVRFWVLENFLSPSFKEFLPHLAKEKGFDYEFVSYKWPSWLRTQSEKQRQIWGYKILFLDVLFPQGLDEIIFVDSDQIVRTDFKELLDIDMKGAPYAFAPMGEDREEMEPYRFWKQGYWKKVLLDQGYSYHISALFRADLKRMRQTKVGDLLRHHYQGLSQGKDNLANLDQDLPNYLQPIIPIHTLPAEWLWCETWCSDAGLPWAKSIDLCNNPLTKEPKLDRARRQIPEWTTYDEEVAALTRDFDRVQAQRAQADAARELEHGPLDAHPKSDDEAVDEAADEASDEHDEL